MKIGTPWQSLKNEKLGTPWQSLKNEKYVGNKVKPGLNFRR
jgi:hypothetical protein